MSEIEQWIVAHPWDSLTRAASIVSFIVSIWAARRAHNAHVDSVRPVLVFTYGSDSAPELWALGRGWQVRNVGRGPALDVEIAYEAFGKWVRRVRFNPIAPGAAVPLGWAAGGGYAWKANYADASGRPYSTSHRDWHTEFAARHDPAIQSATLLVSTQSELEGRTAASVLQEDAPTVLQSVLTNRHA